ncbi:hypothetical protein M514_10251 [Trichuris suis]|uniref:Integrase catalytic domain-containing protein n=1 Tax=Trichuris suis TaxID=68888 RepID=A0A085N9R5_9BILA|nr:hypothetical protein M513_10251 [Trichuris suis]KFD66211.1 hypothetical protein M514_10251 [Trichuris suis]
MSKSCVAPRRVLTIPRLGLQAAVLAVRLSHTAADVMSIDSSGTTYWTDSMSVLKWLKIDSRKLKPFVAHRLSEILANSEVSQWRHVPGKWNPADDVSRGVPATLLARRSHRWWCGPQFLQMPEDSWPTASLSVDEDSVKQELAEHRLNVNALGISSSNAVLRLFDVHSDFSKIMRIVAYLRRFMVREERPYPSMIVTASEIQRATSWCIHLLQMESFAKELDDVSGGRALNIRSPLAALDPFIDKDGILRVGGRLKFANRKVDAKHPIILPGASSFVRRLVWPRHLQLMHSRTERVLAELRAQFWILGGRRSVRRVIDRCLYCRRMNATPLQPIMAPFPKERLRCSAPAFVNVGIDCFGPSQVIVKRSLVKRYGCMFSCLVSRVSHLEVLHSMDAHSFMMALRRFIARRGLPAVIFSDNGRNFVAAEKIIREIFERDQLKRYLADQDIEWKFTPPHGPHFGGVWERLTAVAKRALTAVLNGNTVTDELLPTAFAEVESLLNGRPLGYVGVIRRSRNRSLRFPC